jgi:hypothetical protein
MRNDTVLILSHWSDEAVKYMDLKKSIGHFAIYGVELWWLTTIIIIIVHKLPIQFLVQSWSALGNLVEKAANDAKFKHS